MPDLAGFLYDGQTVVVEKLRRLQSQAGNGTVGREVQSVQASRWHGDLGLFAHIGLRANQFDESAICLPSQSFPISAFIGNNTPAFSGQYGIACSLTPPAISPEFHCPYGLQCARPRSPTAEH
jgi:hypothetical protein